MCGWNIHSSLPEKQNFSTLLVSFRREMNLLSSRSISFFPPKYQENVQSLSLSISLSLYFLYFHGAKTEANGANSKVTGAALFPCRAKTKVALQLGEKGCHAILIEFSLSCFSRISAFLHTLHSVLHRLTVPVPFFSSKSPGTEMTVFMLSM